MVFMFAKAKDKYYSNNLLKEEEEDLGKSKQMKE